MAIRVRVYVPDPDTQLDTYTTIRLYRDTTPDGITTSSALAGTAALVSGTEQYTIDDASGTADSWYAYTLYDATGPVESALSGRWRANETTLALLRLEAARLAAAGYASTCSALGTVSTLTDAALGDVAVDANFQQGAWLWLPDAAAADQLRAIASYSSGAFTPTREWSAAPASGDAYEVYTLAPPVDAPGVAYSWTRAVNDGLRACHWIEALNLGDGQNTGQNDFSLAAFLGGINPDRDIRQVFARRTIDADNAIYQDYDWAANGRFWTRVRAEDDVLLRLFPAPGTDLTVYAEVRRHGEALYADSDATNCPAALAQIAAVWKLYDFLWRNGRGEYAQQAAAWKQRFGDEQRAQSAPGRVLV